jgi:hypothetical protein
LGGRFWLVRLIERNRKLLEQIAQRVENLHALTAANLAPGLFELVGGNLEIGLAIRATRVHVRLVLAVRLQHKV